MSTNKDLLKSDFERLDKASIPTRLDDTAAALEAKLAKEQDERKEERFFWVFALVVIFDILVLPPLEVFAIPIFLLEIVFLIALAKWLGVDWAVVLLERLFNFGRRRQRHLYPARHVRVNERLGISEDSGQRVVVLRWDRVEFVAN